MKSGWHVVSFASGTFSSTEQPATDTKQSKAAATTTV